MCLAFFFLHHSLSLSHTLLRSAHITYTDGCLSKGGQGGEATPGSLLAEKEEGSLAFILERNWPLLPKINVSVPKARSDRTSSLEMHIAWLRSHTFQLIINMQLLLALP